MDGPDFPVFYTHTCGSDGDAVEKDFFFHRKSVGFRAAVFGDFHGREFKAAAQISVRVTETESSDAAYLFM